MTLAPQVMVTVGNLTAFNTGGILLLIIKMTFQAKVWETVHIVLSYYKYQLVCVHLHVCLQQAASESALSVFSRML